MAKKHQTGRERAGPDRAEGFAGQRVCVVPRPIVALAREDAILGRLLPTDAGFFPPAAHHRVNRPRGAAELVLIYGVRGRGWVKWGDETHAVGPGDLAVLPARRGHEYGSQDDDPWSIYWLHLTGSLESEWLARLARGGGVVTVGQEPAIARGFDEIVSILETGYGPQQRLRSAGACWNLLMQLLACLQSPQPSVSTMAQRLDATITHMQRHLDGRLSVAQLAALAMISPQHYAECFKQHTGFSPIDYFLRLRLRQAMSLILTTRRPIKEIAAEVGFENQMYF